eukprot:gene11158-11308_t
MISNGACSTLHAVLEAKLQVNGLTGSVNAPLFEESIEQLHACGLTSIDLEGNSLSGSLSGFWAKLTNLQTLNLGMDPAALKLGLHGTIPASMASMRQLQVLDMGANPFLGGSLPAGLCHDKLEVVYLHGCQLSGNISQFLDCPNLHALDISNNRFGGSLPDDVPWGWRQLTSLDVSLNMVTGSIPKALFQLPMLRVLLMLGNRLTGTIHRSISLLQSLDAMILSGNQLSGTIDDNVYYLPRITMIDLSYNRLTGTISPAIG